METNCRKCHQNQKMENVEHYTTPKNKGMVKMNCIIYKSKIHRFSSKKKEEPEQKEVVLKELKPIV